MSNPGTAATQSSDQGEQQTNDTVSYQDKVNTVLTEATTGDDGKLVFPEDTPESIQFAAVAEKRRRDTQSSWAQNQQQLKAAEAENKKLRELATSKVELDLSAEEKEELDDLKFSDPEAWRDRMNELEVAAHEENKAKLQTLAQESSSAAELERRTQLLTAFNEAHPGVALNDDVIANDLPPRLTKKLESGEVTFEGFLEEAGKYLTTPTKVAQDDLDSPTNMGRVGGGTSPEDSALEQDSGVSYQSEVY